MTECSLTSCVRARFLIGSHIMPGQQHSQPTPASLGQRCVRVSPRFAQWVRSMGQVGVTLLHFHWSLGLKGKWRVVIRCDKIVVPHPTPRPFTFGCPGRQTTTTLLSKTAHKQTSKQTHSRHTIERLVNAFYRYYNLGGTGKKNPRCVFSIPFQNAVQTSGC